METGHLRTTGDMYTRPPSHYPGMQGVARWLSPAASCSENSFPRLQSSPQTQSLSAVQSRLPSPFSHTLEPSPIMSAVPGPKSSGRSSHPDHQEIGNRRVPEIWTSPSPMRKLRFAGSTSPECCSVFRLQTCFPSSLLSSRHSTQMDPPKYLPPPHTHITHKAN